MGFLNFVNLESFPSILDHGQVVVVEKNCGFGTNFRKSFDFFCLGCFHFVCVLWGEENLDWFISV